MRYAQLLAAVCVLPLLLAGCGAATQTQPQASSASVVQAVEGLTPAPATATEDTKASTAPEPTPTLFQKKVDDMKEPFIRIHKAQRTLELYDGDELVACIRVALGHKPEGAKEKEGDNKTPEGQYFICVRNANSKYHLSLGISYPNAEDAKVGLDAGLINETQYRSIVSAQEQGKRPSWSTALGGEIMIHGGGTDSDWTAGCIAVRDEDMDYLWELVPLGTPVEILP